MSFCSRLFLTLLVLFVFQLAPATQADPESEAAAITDLFYDLHFGRAIAAAKDLEIRYPGYPAGEFYLSVALYERYLLEDPPSDNTFRQFIEAGDKAWNQAKAIERSSPAIGHYYQGAVLGFEARALVAQRHYAPAVPKAREAAHQLKTALQWDPSLGDAKIGLGMYYYFLANIPPAAKPVAYLMIGMWGDREKGLAYLKETAENGHAARREAQSILASIYASQREQRWDDAVKLLDELTQRYPHNPRYRLKLVYVLQRKGLWEEAAKIADPDGDWVDDLDPLIKARALAMARYRAAECLIFADHWPEAVVQLDRLESTTVPPKLVDWVALRRGNSLDAQGRHADAMAFYSTIRDKKAITLAQSYMAAPFPAGPRDVMPSHWPISNIPAE